MQNIIEVKDLDLTLGKTDIRGGDSDVKGCRL